MIKWGRKNDYQFNVLQIKKCKSILYLEFFWLCIWPKLTSNIYFLTGFKVVLMLWKRDT